MKQHRRGPIKSDRVVWKQQNELWKLFFKYTMVHKNNIILAHNLIPSSLKTFSNKSFLEVTRKMHMNIKLIASLCLLTLSLQNDTHASEQEDSNESETRYLAINLPASIPRIDDTLTRGEIKAIDLALKLYKKGALNHHIQRKTTAYMGKYPSKSISLLVYIGEEAMLIDEKISTQKN